MVDRRMSMKIRLRINVPVGREHGLTAGRIMDAELNMRKRNGCPVFVVGDKGKKYDLCPFCLVIFDAWLKRKMETVSKDWLDSLQATAPGYDADAKEERIAIQEENKP